MMPTAGACNCAPAPACPQVLPCAAVARADTTHEQAPQKLLDDLELRAIAIGGLDLNRQNDIAIPRELDMIERLVENRDNLTADAERGEVHYRLIGSNSINSGSSDIRKSPLHKKTIKPTEKISKLVYTTSLGTTEIPSIRVDHSTTAPVTRKTRSQPVEWSKETQETIKCNSEQLKQVILDNITENSSLSKRAVNQAAEKTFGGNIDVVCSRGHFSYVYSSNLFCEASKGEVTCIAYRQS
uniref:Ground-like domain-containing protein n=1 Tax=Acrobeloides nanus TaxID=290746 RepID=A0A914DR62_9BILA